MKKVKSVLVSADLHLTLKEYSSSKGYKLGSFIEMLLQESVDKLREEQTRERIQELLLKRKINDSVKHLKK
jgi:metallophosphoesterase superfamily enzyme